MFSRDLFKNLRRKCSADYLHSLDCDAQLKLYKEDLEVLPWSCCQRTLEQQLQDPLAACRDEVVKQLHRLHEAVAAAAATADAEGAKR